MRLIERGHVHTVCPQQRVVSLPAGQIVVLNGLLGVPLRRGEVAHGPGIAFATQTVVAPAPEEEVQFRISGQGVVVGRPLDAGHIDEDVVTVGAAGDPGAQVHGHAPRCLHIGRHNEPGVADKPVVACATGHVLIEARVHFEGVVAGTAEELICATLAFDLVVAATADNEVGSSPGADQIVAPRRSNEIGPTTRDDDVVPGRSLYPIRPPRP